jgi:ribosomal-protein-alanine N-acetyltransferase
MVVEETYLENIITINIRDAELNDLDSILEIEESSYVHPWSRNLIQGSLDNPKAFNFVAFDSLDRRIHGFILNLLLIDELHILNIAVKPLYRRCGIGNSLLETSINKGQKLDVKTAFLEVRRSNVQALTLYIKHGFKVIGVRRGYYSDNREDALVMRKSI